MLSELTRGDVTAVVRFREKSLKSSQHMGFDASHAGFEPSSTKRNVPLVHVTLSNTTELLINSLDIRGWFRGKSTEPCDQTM